MKKLLSRLLFVLVLAPPWPPDIAQPPGPGGQVISINSSEDARILVAPGELVTYRYNLPGRLPLFITVRAQLEPLGICHECKPQEGIQWRLTCSYEHWAGYYQIGTLKSNTDLYFFGPKRRAPAKIFNFNTAGTRSIPTTTWVERTQFSSPGKNQRFETRGTVWTEATLRSIILWIPSEITFEVISKITTEGVYCQ